MSRVAAGWAAVKPAGRPPPAVAARRGRTRACYTEVATAAGRSLRSGASRRSDRLRRGPVEPRVVEQRAALLRCGPDPVRHDLRAAQRTRRRPQRRAAVDRAGAPVIGQAERPCADSEYPAYALTGVLSAISNHRRHLQPSMRASRDAREE